MVKFCIFDNINNKSVTLWLGRLCHIEVSTTKKLIKSSMISCNVDEFNKSKLYVKSKMTKKYFRSIKRNFSLLDLVYSDICALNGM